MIPLPFGEVINGTINIQHETSLAGFSFPARLILIDEEVLLMSIIILPFEPQRADSDERDTQTFLVGDLKVRVNFRPAEINSKNIFDCIQSILLSSVSQK